MYAIVNISGKQFKAIEGARVRVPRQTGEAGAKVTFDNVLLVDVIVPEYSLGIIVLFQVPSWSLIQI